MNNKSISLLKICIIISLFVDSSRVCAGYFYRPDVPDYEIVTVPCYEHHRSSVKHHHYHARHHSVVATYHKHSSYSIVKYYVYSSNNGDLIGIPSPCDCSGTWVEVQHLKSYRGFSQEPYREAGYTDHYHDDVDYDMDMRTSDDIGNEY